MRLLITADTVGGVWRFGLELAQGLLGAGDSVALVSFGRASSPAQRAECEKLATSWGAQFRYLGSEISLEWMQDNCRCYEDGSAVLRQIAREFGAELLHTSQFCYGAAELGIPTVVTAHSDVLSWARACRNEGLEETEWLRRYCALVEKGLDCADAVAAPTKWMLEALAEGYRLPERTRVIANGRSIPVFGAGPRVLRAVTAARLWDEAKDIGMLRTVMSPMPLLVAGERECGGTEFAAPKGMELTGTLREEDMMRLLAASAVYVCTSRYEPFGLAPLEAALCGCAVLARDIASLHEVWGDAALYFGDATELSTLLTRLAKSPEMLREAQRQARVRAQRYTRFKMAEEYRALYAEVLKQTGMTVPAEERACVA